MEVSDVCRYVNLSLLLYPVVILSLVTFVLILGAKNRDKGRCILDTYRFARYALVICYKIACVCDVVSKHYHMYL